MTKKEQFFFFLRELTTVRVLHYKHGFSKFRFASAEDKRDQTWNITARDRRYMRSYFENAHDGSYVSYSIHVFRSHPQFLKSRTTSVGVCQPSSRYQGMSLCVYVLCSAVNIPTVLSARGRKIVSSS